MKSTVRISFYCNSTKIYTIFTTVNFWQPQLPVFCFFTVVKTAVEQFFTVYFGKHGEFTAQSIYFI